MKSAIVGSFEIPAMKIVPMNTKIPVLKVLLVLWMLLLLLFPYLADRYIIHRQATLIPLVLLFVTFAAEIARSRVGMPIPGGANILLAAGTPGWKAMLTFFLFTGTFTVLVGIDDMLGSLSDTLEYVVGALVLVAALFVAAYILRIHVSE